MSSVSHPSHGETSSDRGSVAPESTALHRGRLLNILFVHRDADTVDGCLQELKQAQFVVTSDVVLNLTQGAAQLRSKPYDVIVVECPSPSCKGSEILQLSEQTGKEIPPIVLIL